jgi:TonB family protein
VRALVLVLVLVACAHAVGDDPQGAHASGALTDDAVARVVRRRHDDIRACYDIGLARVHGLAGTVRLDFAIEASGATTGARIRESTLESDEVDRCLVDIASRWRFPSAQVRRTVSLPLEFAPEEDLDAPPLP